MPHVVYCVSTAISTVLQLYSLFFVLERKESKCQYGRAVAFVACLWVHVVQIMIHSSFMVLLPMGLCYSNACTLTRNILQQEAVVLLVLPCVLCHLQQHLSVSNSVDDSMFHFLQYSCLLLHKNSNLKTVDLCISLVAEITGH